MAWWSCLRKIIGPLGVLNFIPSMTLISFSVSVDLAFLRAVTTAMAAATEAAGLTLGHDSLLPFVTGNLNVSFMSPTPVGVEIELRARIKELGPRKIVVTCSVLAEGRECARGEVVAVRMPSNFQV